MGKLSGIRVLDLSRVLAGPYCTALLGDLGAEIIKIEPPRGGDDARHLGPFLDGESTYFALINRNKKSVSLNLKDGEALEIFLDLVRRSDVLVENFRPGVTRRLGIDYETLKSVNPRLVYASISGFGQTGPLSQRPAYDLIVQAMSGLMTITGAPDGPPTRVGESIGDLCAGLFAAWAIGAALFQRERTGQGEHLDIAMFDSLLALQVTALSQYAMTGEAPMRVGNRHPISTPFDTYRAADGLVVIAVANEGLFARLATLMGRPDLPRDPRFVDDAARTENEPALRGIVESWTARRSVEEIVAACLEAAVPASPIWDLGQAIDSAQTRARGLLHAVPHAQAGEIKLIAQPVKFAEEPGAAPRRAPRLGEHAESVLADLLGLSPDRLAALRERGAI